MMTKEQAIEILHANKLANLTYAACESLADDLDRAGAFPSEATEAEIDDVARTILNADRGTIGVRPDTWRNIALRLASACRAAGLVSR